MDQPTITPPLNRTATHIDWTPAGGSMYSPPKGFEIVGGFAAGPSPHKGSNPIVGVMLRRVTS